MKCRFGRVYLLRLEDEEFGYCLLVFASLLEIVQQVGSRILDTRDGLYVEDWSGMD